jgi:hypothetical protein
MSLGKLSVAGTLSLRHMTILSPVLQGPRGAQSWCGPPFIHQHTDPLAPWTSTWSFCLYDFELLKQAIGIEDRASLREAEAPSPVFWCTFPVHGRAAVGGQELIASLSYVDLRLALAT